ncbi:MAG: aminotransferase class V-fold PLP-dependent enzyme [Candidatus Aenigmatarchaeota archaeon]
MIPSKIREDFPILQKQINGKPIVYADNACMTLKPRQIVEKMNEYYNEYTACVGRSNHKLGKKATEEYNKARKKIAEFIRCKDNEVIFTRNTTEGINLIAHSFGLKSGDVVVNTDKEHNSNLVPWQLLEKNGIKRIIIPSKDDNTFDIERFKSMIIKDVKLVSIVHTSNLDGVTNPIKEIIKIAHDQGARVLIDGAQSIPHKEIDVRKLDIDFLAFSGHKMCGPTGTGILYGKHDLLEKLEPFMVGGDTVDHTTYTEHKFLKPPEKFEAGLQNYAGMIGLGEACNYIRKIGIHHIEKHEIELNKIITDGISQIPGLKILGPQNPSLRGGVISMIVEKMHPHDISLMLDNTQNIFIRSGQHCVHSWFRSRKIEGSARASLYFYNTKEEAELFVETMKKIVKIR